MLLRSSLNSLARPAFTSLVCPSILFIHIHQLTICFSGQHPHSPPVSQKLRNVYVALGPEFISIHPGSLQLPTKYGGVYTVSHAFLSWFINLNPHIR